MMLPTKQPRRSSLNFVPAFVDKVASAPSIWNIPVSTAETSDPVIVRCEHLGRVLRFEDKDKVLIADATFDVRTGEVLAIVGPSGSGKSSLLRLLNRLDEPTSGTVFVDGADYRQIPPQELRRKLGMVTQRPYLFPGTVGKNLRFGPSQRGINMTQEAVDQILLEVGLKGYAARDIAKLSGGESQRVSIARSLANSPLVLLLDEPTSALDELSKREIELLIQKIVREQKLTCVLVTHDRAQASRLAQRAILLDAGHIAGIGPVDELLHA
jgi:putative ABC transport system ATP-binding protein